MHRAELKDRLQTNLWLAPAAGVLIALCTAFALVALEHRFKPPGEVWFLFDGGAESSQRVLSMISTSMLTLTALVFSITVLVLQLASTQFSPRVIRTFLQQPTTKWTMAVFVGTFVYAMAVLSQVRTEPDVFVPRLATWFGLILVLASVGVFIHYIHRMAHSVRAISLIASIAEETRHSIEAMYPDEIGDEPVSAPRRPDGDAGQLVHHTGAPGVITAIDGDELFDAAQANELVIEIVPRVGEFVPTGSLILRVWGGTVDAAWARSQVTLEEERTPNQDPGFGFRQLVDIAVRALSPGINDPTTAVQSLDHLYDLVRRLTVRAFPSPARSDHSGTVRLIAARPDYRDFVTLAFEEIRDYGQSSIQIKRRIRSALEECIAIAPSPRREVLLEQLGLLVRSSHDG